MDTRRVLILGVAALAAGAAALLARGLLGGGTEKVKAAPPPPRPATVEVLVASSDVQAGSALAAGSVHWQEWPKSAVDSSFITHDTAPDIERVVQGTVARAPLVSGEPLTAAKMIHADSAGFMAAMVGPGMRAVSIGISTESGAGGFILPNDHVDVLCTGQVSDTPRRFATITFLRDVRVLAVDQTYKEDKDQKVVLAKTATLEVTPHQAELLEQAQASGTISLTLRALGETPTQKAASTNTGGDADTMPTAVIRYGIGRLAGGQGE